MLNVEDDEPEMERGGGGGRGRGGRRAGAGRSKPIELQPEDESSLYYIIRNGKASLQQVVDDWIDNYKVSYIFELKIRTSVT